MKNILEFIENSALKYPDKLAVADEEGGLTYGQMERLSRQIGAWIYEKTDGVRNKPVAVLLDKKPGSVAAYMGVVYSGNFYVVLDAEMPASRAESILGTLNPVAVVTDIGHMEKALELSRNGVDEDGCQGQEGENKEVFRILNLDELDTSVDQSVLDAVRSRAIDTDPVYALFTSGSTGVPKGAVVSHRNVISYTYWYTEAFGIDESTIFGSQTPFYFSMSVSDLYSTLKKWCHAVHHTEGVFHLPYEADGVHEYIQDQHDILGAIGTADRCKLQAVPVRPASRAEEGAVCRRGDADKAAELLDTESSGCHVCKSVRPNRDDRHMYVLRGGQSICR